MLQAWRLAHPPKRGIYILGTRPMVHKGFYRAWESIAPAFMEAVQMVLENATASKEDFKIFLTGAAPVSSLLLKADHSRYPCIV